MDIRNSPSKEAVQAASEQFRSNAVEAVLEKVANPINASTMMINGHKLKMRYNLDVRGSDRRDISKPTLVYQDAMGRLTIDPIGKSEVGYILWGGTNGRACHVGFIDA